MTGKGRVLEEEAVEGVAPACARKRLSEEQGARRSEERGRGGRGDAPSALASAPPSPLPLPK